MARAGQARITGAAVDTQPGINVRTFLVGMEARHRAMDTAVQSSHIPHVVTDNCHFRRFTDCVAV
jgi:hypothetical protein